jgi:hypothetical protein
MPRRPRQTLFIVSTAAWIGLPALLGGCDGHSAEADAVAAAARKLASVGSDGLNEAGVNYASVSRDLGAISGREGYTGQIGSGLLAQSRQGEGSISAGESMRAERALFDRSSSARHLARRWSMLSTTAEALIAYDPTADLNAIAAVAQRLADDAQRTRRELEETRSRIDALQAEIDGLREQSGAKRNRAAERRLASAAMSAVDASREAVTIRQLSREADALDMQANRISGQVAALLPRVAELTGEVEKLTEQRNLKIRFGEELRQSVQSRAEEAVRARAEAGEIAARIDAIVREISQEREDKVLPASEAAIASFNQASQSSDKASRAQRVPGTLSKSASQRRLAEALHLRAHGHGASASLLEELAATIPALPGASRYRDLATEERRLEREFADRAAEAYRQSANALRNAGGRGDERERLEAAAAALEALAVRLSGGTPPTETPPPTDEDPDQQWDADDQD